MVTVTRGEKDTQKEQYLEDGGVKPIHIFMLQSKVKATGSARVRVCLEDKEKVLDPSF